MRLAVALVVLLAGVAVVGAVAAPSPTYTISFQGTGSEHQVDDKQNVEDDGSCEAAEHIDVTAAVTWSASWSRFRASSRSALGAPSRIDGSRVTGTHVKDACGLPLDQAPPEWVSQASCDDALVTSAGPQLSAATRGKSLMLAGAAPSVLLALSVECPLNGRQRPPAAHTA